MLVVALGLRLWGVKQGLPYAYNADENAHFVPKAIGLFGHGWNPHYFVNPPAYTYLLHVVFAVWFGGRAGVSQRLAINPTEVFVVARVTAAACSARSRCGCCTSPGARLFDRARRPARRGAAGRRLPARLLLAPRAQRRADAGADRAVAVGHRRRAARAGACATTARRASGSAWPARRSTPAGSCCCRSLAAGASAGGPGRAHAPRARARARGGRRAGRLRRRQPLRAARLSPPSATACNHQADAAGDELGKLGLDAEPRHRLLPVDADLGARLGAARSPRVVGASAARRDDRRASLVLGPAPILFMLFMGTQERFFGRWLLPIFPIVCLLGRLRVVELAELAPARAGAAARAAVAAAPCCCSARAIVYSLHAGWCSRATTRATRRAHGWSRTSRRARRSSSSRSCPTRGPATSGTRRRARPTAPAGQVPDEPLEDRQRRLGLRGPGRIVNIEDYERTLFPGLIDQYERDGLLLGGHRLDAARARRGRAARTSRARSPTTASSSAARRSSTGLALPPGRRARAVQLRLVLRLLPAGLRPARAGDAGLPPARAATMRR